MSDVTVMDNGWMIVPNSRNVYSINCRGVSVIAWVDHRGIACVDGTAVSLVQLETGEWWITCMMYIDEPHFTDIGPFATLEEAVIQFRLIATFEQRGSL